MEKQEYQKPELTFLGSFEELVKENTSAGLKLDATFVGGALHDFELS